jgi:nucleoside triphosphate pyrophosphatase
MRPENVWRPSFQNQERHKTIGIKKTATFLLILASGSPRRKTLLQELGLHPKIVPAEIEEIPNPGEDPVSFSRRMAEGKASIVSTRYPDYWVLGADTVVTLDETMFGKPRDDREAKNFLQALSGKTHRVITGFCLKNGSRARLITRSVSTQVTFKKLSLPEINWYVRTGEPRDKAGAYAVQGKGAFCVKKIRGSYTNVVGLPVTEVLEALIKYAGFHLG